MIMLSSLLQLLCDNIVTISLVIAVYICISWLFRRPANFPPGPWAIPFIGSPAVFIAGNQPEIFADLRKKYGDVFCFYTGSKPFVVVGGLEAHKEGLLKLGHATSDRPSFFITEVLDNKGLISTNGKFWKEQRTFTVSKLRQFGMGKVSLESQVLEEVEVFVEYIKSCGGQPVNLKNRLSTCISNVIFNVVFKKRFRHDDSKLVDYMAALNENFNLMTSFVLLFPWLLNLPGDPFKFNTIKKNFDKMREFTRVCIEEHKADFHPEIIRDFTDAYLAEMKLKETDHESSYSDAQLGQLVTDLTVAGTDTTGATILWGILYLTLQPEVQRKLQEEIDSVVGGDRYASVTDKPSLPYTEATLMEIQRIANIIIALFPHTTSEEITLNGYAIPKGAIMMFLIGDTLSDPEVWDNPKQFNPDRFLKDGKVVNADKFFPFSLGRRSCPGEALAKMEIFLFFTALMQRFTFKFQDGEPPASTERVMGFTISPLPYRVCAVPR